MTAPRAEGRVLGALAEVAEQADTYAGQLSSALARSEHVRQSITDALDRVQEAKSRYKQLRHELSEVAEIRDTSQVRAGEAGEVVERASARLVEINEMREFGAEDPKLFEEMGRAAKAKNDKIKERDKYRQRAEQAAAKVEELKTLAVTLEHDVEVKGREVKELQKELPDPHLFAWLGMAHMSRANAHYLLTGDVSQFDRIFRQGVQFVRQMHREMREGRYRLDRYGDLLAARHEASVQAMYGAVAVGDVELAGEIFSLAADPGMFFHQIFNVFRAWLLGSYLLGDRKVFARLVRMHRYERGLRQAYCRCFTGLFTGDARTFELGLKSILNLEQIPDDVARIPGLGLVHLPACGLMRLARLKNLVVRVEDARLPSALLAW